VNNKLVQTNKKKIGVLALLIVAAIALITAIAHLSCIVLGAGCYRAQLAPEVIVNSAIQKTWLAPIGTTIISALFLVCALYTVSAAKIIRPMPFLRLAIFAISGLCVTRGLATFPILMTLSDKAPAFAVVSGFIWFLSGVLCIVGYCLVGDSRNST